MLSSVLITFHKSLYLWEGLNLFLSVQKQKGTLKTEKRPYTTLMSVRSFYMAEPAYPDYGRQLITDLIVFGRIWNDSNQK